MKLIFILLLVFSGAISLSFPQSANGSEELQKQIEAIDKSTDYSNPHQRIEAQKKIKKLWEDYNAALLKQINANKPKETIQPMDSTINVSNLIKTIKNSLDTIKELDKEAVYIKNGIFDAAINNKPFGDTATEVFLSDLVKKQVTEEYEEEYKPEIKNPQIFEIQTTLIIDLSLPSANMLIKYLDKFTGIKHLIVTGGKNPAPFDLPLILNKIKNMPLETLYIINCKQYITSIPSSVFDYPNLTEVGLYNNSLTALPGLNLKYRSLEKFYVDVNPIKTLPAWLKEMKNLKELGLGKTDIAESEIKNIQELFPSCKVLLK